MKIKMIPKNAQEFLTQLNKLDRLRIRASHVAVKREGYLLRKEMQNAIKSGGIGELKFSQLTLIAQKFGRKRGWRDPNSALRRLAFAVRYTTNSPGKGEGFFKSKPLNVSIGFTKIKGQGLASAHQEGFEKPVTDKMREALRKLGMELRESGDFTGRHFFIKPETKVFRTPKREIVEPFWNRRVQRSFRRISNNFHRKLSGERI